MSESFDSLYQKALAAAAGGHDRENVVHWPRFYSKRFSDGDCIYFMATEESKGTPSYKGYKVDWPAGRRVPLKAVYGTMMKPRLGDPSNMILTNVHGLPEPVIARFRDKLS